jgi:hypothetical protein
MGAQSTLRKQRRLREGGKLHDEYEVTTTPRHRDIMMIDGAARIRLSCLAPRARDLAGGLVRSPVPLLARPAAVHDALARVAHAGGAIGAARARAAAELASPGRACARTRGSGARRRAALSRAGGKRDGLRRDRHGRHDGKRAEASNVGQVGVALCAASASSCGLCAKTSSESTVLRRMGSSSTLLTLYKNNY